MVAAILVTSLNFSGTMTLPSVLVASVVLPLILLPTARRLGARVTGLEATTEAQPATVIK